MFITERKVEFLPYKQAAPFYHVGMSRCLSGKYSLFLINKNLNTKTGLFSTSFHKVHTTGPLVLTEGGDPAFIVVTATLPPDVMCQLTNLSVNEKCRIMVVAYMDVKKTDQCGKDIIPQAVIGNGRHNSL